MRQELKTDWTGASCGFFGRQQVHQGVTAWRAQQHVACKVSLCYDPRMIFFAAKVRNQASCHSWSPLLPVSQEDCKCHHHIAG